MLNCCIERKACTELGGAKADLELDPDGDAFFDCVESVDAPPPRPGRAEGRLRPLDGASALFACPAEPVFVPVTQAGLAASPHPAHPSPLTFSHQDPAPFTEDMLDEHTQSLLQLGSSPEAARLRSRLQCPALVSDMEAFKVPLVFPFSQ